MELSICGPILGLGNSTWSPGIQHAVLGDKLPAALSSCINTGGSFAWRGCLVYMVSNALMFQTPDASRSKASLAILIWHQLRTYMELDWSQTLRQLTLTSNRSHDRLLSCFSRKWVYPPLGPVISHRTLQLPAVPFLTTFSS